jgi:hypothetical protein
LLAVHLIQGPRKSRLRVTSEGVRGSSPGHLPNEMEVDRDISEGWNKAICSASTASQRRRCSGVRGIVGGGVKGSVGKMSLIVRVGKGGMGVGVTICGPLSGAKGWMGMEEGGDGFV